jgi:hypothetical protein
VLYFSPTVQETNIDNTNDVFEPFEEDTKMDFGNTVVQDNQDADDDWTIEQPQGNEFFSVSVFVYIDVIYALEEKSPVFEMCLKGGSARERACGANLYAVFLASTRHLHPSNHPCTTPPTHAHICTCFMPSVQTLQQQADEQARIWQELREAESNAATNEPSATDKAKAAARSAAVSNVPCV